MTYTLWQYSPSAKKPFKETQEKMEVLGLAVLLFCGEGKGAAYSIFLDQ